MVTPADMPNHEGHFYFLSRNLDQMQLTLTYKTFFQKFLGESGIFITGSTSLLYNTHKKTENKIKKKSMVFCFK